MSHFDEISGLLYLDGALDAESAREIDAHARECAACQELLGALQKEGTWLRESLSVEEDDSVPARLRDWRESEAMPLSWIGGAGIAAAGAYTVWSGFVDPWLSQAAEAGFSQGSLLTEIFFAGAFWKGWDMVQNMMEFLAIATIGVTVIWLLRNRWRRFTTVAVVIAAFACALALPSASEAADLRHGNPNFTLPSGEEVKTDLIVAAQRTRIDGDVDGDLIVWSRSITVNGHVKGDVIVFGQEVRVDGPVDGNVRAFAGSLTLNGTVEKNVMAWAGEIEMDEKARIGGTMMIGSRNAQLDGHVTGDLLAVVGVLDINGSLGHNATVRAGTLSIGQSAKIDGQTKYSGRRQPDVSPGAKLAQPIMITAPRRGPDYTRVRYYWREFLLWGASLVFGIALIWLAPQFFSEVTVASKKVGPSIGWGLLFLFAIPIAAIIACVTIVGLSVGIASLIVYMIALYAAQIFVGSWLGEKLLGAAAEMGSIIGRLALGLAILRVLRMIPFAGPLVGLVVTIWGLGALVLTCYRKLRPPISSPA